MSLLPHVALYPKPDWKNHLSPEEWEACLDSWITIGRVYLALSDSDFRKYCVQDVSLLAFINSFVTNMALSNELPVMGDSSKLKSLHKTSYFLSHRFLDSKDPLNFLPSWEFLADASKVFGPKNTRKIYSLAYTNHCSTLESSMKSLKNFLTRELDAGVNGDLIQVESQLRRLNYLLRACPDVSIFFMVGIDFLDALITGYKITNPSLRKVIISNMYLCLIGLAEGQNPNLSLLIDQLFSLKAAAEAHRDGNSYVNDSLVPELVTVTPILKKLQQRVSDNDGGSARGDFVISSLEKFRKPNRSERCVRNMNRKIEKGKDKVIKMDNNSYDVKSQTPSNRVSLISQVQELLPHLGSGFIARLLTQYEDNLEVVISHLLEGSLPPHLDKLDKNEPLENIKEVKSTHNFEPEESQRVLPTRRNVYDNDEFDRLAVKTSRIHFGRHSSQTSECSLDDGLSVVNKTAIISALAAFDSNDDERDDTYDIEDIGGTVDLTNPEENLEIHTPSQTQNMNDDILFQNFKSNPEVFERDGVTRRGIMRKKLREQTGLTNEMIEGWAIMLKRNPKLLRKLEMKSEETPNTQRELAKSAWRADESEEQNSTRTPGSSSYFRVKNNEVATANDRKSRATRRANHNRKNKHAKKIARGFSG
ncbi:putative cue domain-containing protein [Golovinomyces cichoracearum]|uniref:Putative cue domain-containing protein n=1 Tax=Golovinomyces cichoracearum TaxID=62708 RepID=A0A420IZG0_9PEZI|nr:putative cue domain-containing protein [Golovinomyces cichoracearum]